MSFTNTNAPASASAVQICAPTPLPPPVTSARRPSSEIVRAKPSDFHDDGQDHRAPAGALVDEARDGAASVALDRLEVGCALSGRLGDRVAHDLLRLLNALRAGAVSSGRVDIDELVQLVNPTLPPGMAIQAVAHVEPGSPSLQESVESCTWLVDVPQLTPEEAHDLVERALTAQALPVTRERKGKSVTDDIRPNVLALRVADPDERPPAAAMR